MVRRAIPGSKPIERMSPTTLNRILACPLQQAFRQHLTPRQPVSSPSARLGIAAHATLETVVTDQTLFSHGWRTALDHAWERHLSAQVEMAIDTGELQRWGEPEGWPGFHQRRARLTTTAHRLRELLAEVAPNADCLPEQQLISEVPPLEGKPDLVVRSPKFTWVIDYKSGAGVDPETGDLRAGYRRQLELYAYLEHSETGTWPTEAWLIPFKGKPIGIVITPQEADAAAIYAEEVRNQYNSRIPNPQPATPSVPSCRFCAYIPSCAAFWDASSSLDSAGLSAITGKLTGVHQSLHGGVTLEVAVSEGADGKNGRLVLRRIDPDEHPAVRGLHAGDVVAAAGIYRPERRSEDAEAGEWRLGSFGRVWSLGPGSDT